MCETASNAGQSGIRTLTKTIRESQFPAAVGKIPTGA